MAADKTCPCREEPTVFARAFKISAILGILLSAAVAVNGWELCECHTNGWELRLFGCETLFVAGGIMASVAVVLVRMRSRPLSTEHAALLFALLISCFCWCQTQAALFRSLRAQSSASAAQKDAFTETRRIMKDVCGGKDSIAALDAGGHILIDPDGRLSCVPDVK
jgi:hypothetical protein